MADLQKNKNTKNIQNEDQDEFQDLVNPKLQTLDPQKKQSSSKQSEQIFQDQPIKVKTKRKTSKQVREEQQSDSDSENTKNEQSKSSKSAVQAQQKSTNRQKSSSHMNEDEVDSQSKGQTSEQKKPSSKQNSAQLNEDDVDNAAEQQPTAAAEQKQPKSKFLNNQDENGDQGNVQNFEEQLKQEKEAQNNTDQKDKAQSKFLANQQEQEPENTNDSKSNSAAAAPVKEQQSQFLQVQDEQSVEKTSESKDKPKAKGKSQFLVTEETEQEPVATESKGQSKSKFLNNEDQAQEQEEADNKQKSNNQEQSAQDTKDKQKSQFLNNQDQEEQQPQQEAETQPKKAGQASKFLAVQDQQQQQPQQESQTETATKEKQTKSKFLAVQEQQTAAVKEAAPVEQQKSKFLNNDDQTEEAPKPAIQIPQVKQVVSDVIFFKPDDKQDDQGNDSNSEEQTNTESKQSEQSSPEVKNTKVEPEQKPEVEQKVPISKKDQKKGRKKSEDDLDEDALLEKLSEQNKQRQEEEKQKQKLQEEQKKKKRLQEQEARQKKKLEQEEAKKKRKQEQEAARLKQKQLQEEEQAKQKSAADGQENDEDDDNEEQGQNKDKNKKKQEKQKKEPVTTTTKQDEPKKPGNAAVELARRRAQELEQERKRIEREKAEQDRREREYICRDIFEDILEEVERIKRKNDKIKKVINKPAQQDQQAIDNKQKLIDENPELQKILESGKTSNVVKTNKQNKDQFPKSGGNNNIVSTSQPSSNATKPSDDQNVEEVKSQENQPQIQEWEDLEDLNETNNKKVSDPSPSKVVAPVLTEKEQKEKTQNDLKVTNAEDYRLSHPEIQPYVKPSQDMLRSPICCILGHVDTGKTTLLDKIRNTNVQEGEAGGITQQIGATFFPGEKLKQQVEKCSAFYKVEVQSPGLLIIDTPGHESFANLRKRGSSLADVAILVIDLMHGLENQTVESMNLLRQRKTPFIIALNKIDRCYDWKSINMGSSKLSLALQSQACQDDFDRRFKGIITELNEKGINAALYWDLPDPKEYVSIVPTSGVTGEGIPDILAVIMKYTMQYMKTKMIIKQDEFNCTVMEVKMIEGHGTTIDAILIDGVLQQNDEIVLLGWDGPIETQVRAILTPHPMKEMRVKGEYISHEVIHAAMGLKISAPQLEMAVAGCQLYLVHNDQQRELAQRLIEKELDEVKERFPLSTQGIGVCASTLGSLEALLAFLKQQKIPVSYWSVGPVSKDDILKALKSVLADDPNQVRMEYACMLVFNLKVLPDAQQFADDNGVKIFNGEIIYHLETMYIEYVKQIVQERKKQELENATWPCMLKIVQVFRANKPIIMGVDVERGVLQVGTRICVYNKEKLKLGVVESIEKDHKSLKEARKETGSVAIRINADEKITAGRHFAETDKLVSIITRDSIDCLKTHFQEEVKTDQWLFIRDVLKQFFEII